MRQWVLRLAGVVCVVLLLGACTTPPPPARCGGEGPVNESYAQPVTAPVVANGVVYLGFQTPVESRLVAFRASDGMLLWQRPDPAGALVWLNPAEPVDSPTLALAGDTVLLLSNSIRHRLVALRTSDGVLLWQLPRSVSMRATPVVQDGVLYTFDDDGLYAVRLADGQVLWSVPPPSGQREPPSAPPYNPHTFGPVVTGGVVYMGWPNGPLVAVRASDGAQLWQVAALPPPPEQGSTTPIQPDPVAVIGDVLYVRMGGEFAYAVLLVRTRDGAILRRIQAPAAATGTSVPPGTVGTPGTVGGAGGAGPSEYALDPVVIGGTLYLGVNQGTADPSSPNHRTYVLQTLDGQRLWQVPLSDSPTHLMAQDDGIVFVGSTEVIAVRMDDGMMLWRQRLVPGWGTFVAAGSGDLYVSAFGVGSYCNFNPPETRSPTLQALNETDGHVMWTRTFPVTTS